MNDHNCECSACYEAHEALDRVWALCDDNRGLYAYAEYSLVDAVECYRIREAINGGAS